MLSRCSYCGVALMGPVEEHALTRSELETKSDTERIDHCPGCGQRVDEPVDSTTQSFEAPTEAIRQFSHFQLLEILGQGGFGTVWLALDTRLQRQVALKLPTRRPGRSDSLIHEARTAAKLRHPNIVSVHEVGEFEGQVFIVCEYIQGTNLHQYLRDESFLPFGTIVELLIAIASGLQHAHDHMIVHRDIKPANVLIDSAGKPLVTDFGLAKKTDVEESLSSKGRIVGTLLYMAPEQAGLDVDGVDHRADIYAMGIMMYEMLTGERPYRGDMKAIVQQKLTIEPTPLRQLRPTVPLDLETICLKCLQLSPARRYDSADAFRLELERFQEGVPILARPITNIEYAWRWCLRNRSVAILGTLFVFSLIVGLVSTTFYWSHAVKETARAQRSLYDSQMLLAGYHLDVGDTEAVRQIVDRVSDPGYEGMRGFEYKFLQREISRTRNQVTHGRSIQSIAISRAGDWFVTVADDRDLIVWPSSGSEPRRTVSSEVGRWTCVDVSHRDNRVAAGAKDGTVYVWRSILAVDAEPVLVKHGVSVAKVVFSKDGQRLFTVGTKGAIRVWDSESLQMLQDLPTGKDGLVDFAVSRDGKLAVTVDGTGTIRSWDVDGRSIVSLVETGKKIMTVDLAPESETFIVGTYDSDLAVYNTNTCEPVYEENTSYEMISDVKFLGNSSIVAISSSLGVTVIFDCVSQGEVNRLSTHKSAGAQLASSQNGNSIVVGAKDGTATQLDLDPLKQRDVLSIGRSIGYLAFMNDNVIAVAVDDGRVLTADVETGETNVLFKSPTTGMTPLAVSASGGWLAYRTEPNLIQLATHDGKRKGEIRIADGRRFSIWASEKGRWLLVGDTAGKVSGYQIGHEDGPRANSAFERIMPERSAPTAVFFSPDQSFAMVGTRNAQLWRLNLATLEMTLVPARLQSPASSIGLIDADLIVGLESGHLMRIRPKDGASLWRLKAHRTALNELIVLPQESTVVTVGRDEAVHIFDAVDGGQRFRMIKHEHQIFSIGISSDSQKIATGGMDGHIRIWRGDAERFSDAQ